MGGDNYSKKLEENEYIFYYFPVMVRGEPIRMLLAHAKVKFEDKKISMEEWPSQKSSMPNGQMPALELRDGRKLG